jgi:hypothetical protein
MYCVKGESKKCMKVDFSDQQFSLKGGDIPTLFDN